MFIKIVDNVAKPCRAREGNPVLTISNKEEKYLDIFLIDKSTIVLFLKNGIINKIKLIVWEITVAIDAPLIPNLNAKINNGSKIILITPPVTNPIIANLDLPSDLKILFNTNAPVIIGEPSKI